MSICSAAAAGEVHIFFAIHLIWLYPLVSQKVGYCTHSGLVNVTLLSQSLNSRLIISLTWERLLPSSKSLKVRIAARWIKLVIYHHLGPWLHCRIPLKSHALSLQLVGSVSRVVNL